MALLLGLVGLLQAQAVYAVCSLTIETTVGPVTRLINGTTPHVAQFLGIPFAEPPIGERRWLPPMAKSREESIDATKFGLGCPQYSDNRPSVWSTDAPEFNTPPDTTGEDCLSINVWTPWGMSQNSSELLPVIVWIYGGAFQTGAGNILYQNPSQWVERTQKHIVVSINYRLNIFGFPNAQGLDVTEQNLGLLDQRLSLEWVRSNVANFGGDPARITLWGQSAGAVSVDLYNFAYPEDPIVSALIMDSGTAYLSSAPDDSQHTNFTFVATHFGCGNPIAQAELNCLRNVSSTDIIGYLETRDNAQAKPGLSFQPIVDGRTKFTNTTTRALAGNFTKKPAIIGTTDNEGAGFVDYSRTNPPSQADMNAATLSVFQCRAVRTTQDRYAIGVPTFRYLYGGNFSNIAPQPWEGAYHSSELPLIFGTHGIRRGASTPFEIQVSMQMQNYWLMFAQDPLKGLPALGWDAYTPQGNGVYIGKKDILTQLIAQRTLEMPCNSTVGGF